MEQWTKDEFLARLENGETGAFYLYTPLCGTCQVASRMIVVVEQLVSHLSIGQADLNYIPEIAESFSIESVPCLILFDKNGVKEKIYAFQSVPYLYEKLKSLSS